MFDKSIEKSYIFNKIFVYFFIEHVVLTNVLYFNKVILN